MSAGRYFEQGLDGVKASYNPSPDFVGVKCRPYLADTIKAEQDFKSAFKDLVMFGTTKTAKLTFKPKLFTVRWYPCSRNFGGARRRKFHPNPMPPLMVRKPEWRR